MRLRTTKRRAPLARRLLVSGATALGLAACGHSANAASARRAPSVASPLDTVVATPSGTWAVVAMGDLGRLRDTFWELLFRGTGGKWSVVTPPGVADNGGIAISPTGAPARPGLTAGFEPSELLGFSPLAASTDAGRHWTAAILPSKLASVPDALADRPGGGVLALSRASGGELYQSPSGLATWSRVVTRAQIAASAAGRACNVGNLSAAAVEGQTELLGATCLAPGVVGVFGPPVSPSAAWQLVGPRLTGLLARCTTRVLALSGEGLNAGAGLVAATDGHHTSVVAIWRTAPTSTWSVSPGLPVASNVTVQSVGTAASGEAFLVEKGPRGGLSVATVSPGRRWSRIASLPAGTATVELGAGGQVDALTVASSVFSDWARDPATGRWSKRQSIDVAIPFGSSG